MKTMSWKSIVVAVADPSRRKQIGIAKAAEIAERCGAKLTLLHTFAFPFPVRSPMSSQEVLDHTVKVHHKRLVELAKPLRSRGLEVQIEVEWDFPPHEAVVRYALKTHADLVVAETHRRGPMGRWLLRNTDWELIRACPMPLWLVKRERLAAKPSFIAAVDPLHARAKPAQLDDGIVDIAKQAAHATGGAVNLVHVCQSPLDAVPSMAMDPAILGLATAAQSRQYLKLAKDKLMLLAKRYRIAATRVLIKQGNPVVVLPALIKNDQVMVMGSVSRRGISRIFIGNTAEEVLDRVTGDVIVIKPKSFKTPVPRRVAKLGA